MSRRSRKSKRRLNSLFMMTLLIGMLLLSSTYAWFSANKEVSVTGINAKVNAAEGLQVSLDGVKWSSTLSVTSATLAAAVSNQYQWPSALVPVSTDGSTTSGHLNLYYGDISADGTTLNSSAKQTDVAVGGSATSGYYIAFDLYFKNQSSQTSDDLEFNNGTSIAIASDGVANTGLENCMRAAVVLWDGTAAVTASATDVRSISTSSDMVCIWEPNALTHIAEVTNSGDSRISSESTDLSSRFKTLGIVHAGDLSGVNGSSAVTDVMAVQESYATTGGTIGSETAMYNLGSTTSKLQLTGSKVMKTRIYIWIEGQDPDCIDTASNGKSIDITLAFTKPTVTH